MVSSAELTREAANITHQAELGRPSDLQQVNAELQKDMKNYSPSDYNKLLNGIKQQNGADQKANSHLPSLELYDSKGGNSPDSVMPRYSDATSANTPNASVGDGHGPDTSTDPTSAVGHSGDSSSGSNTSSSNGAGADIPPNGNNGNGSDKPPDPPDIHDPSDNPKPPLPPTPPSGDCSPPNDTPPPPPPGAAEVPSSPAASHAGSTAGMQAHMAMSNSGAPGR
jgi:hypothetical protein